METLSSKSLFEYYGYGSPALDGQNGIYYIVGTDYQGKTRLFGVDVQTGDIISKPEITHSGGIHQLAYNCIDQSLYGIGVSSNPNGRYLIRIDPKTAKVTSVSVSVFEAYHNGSPAIDFYNGTYYIVGLDNQARYRLFGIDLKSGKVVSNPIPSGLGELHHLAFNCRDSTLYALEVFKAEKERYLVKVDPATGLITRISPKSVFTQYIGGSPAIDPYNGTYTVLGFDENSDKQLYTIDLISGKAIHQLKVGSSNEVHQFQYFNTCSSNADFSFRDSCFGNKIYFKTRSSGIFHWDFGDTGSGHQNYSDRPNPVHVFSDTGSFKVSLRVEGCFQVDSMEMEVQIDFLNRRDFLSNDTSICKGDVLLLDASTKGASYKWFNGSVDSTVEVDTPGRYWAMLKGNKCIVYDTIDVRWKEKPGFDLGEDTSLCDGQSHTLNVNNHLVSVKWQDSITSDSFVVKNAGIYYVEVSKEGCSYFDTINIVYKPLPIVNLGDDTSACSGDTIFFNLTRPGAAYTWSTGSNSGKVSITQTQDLWVNISENGCNAIDSIIVVFHDSATFFLGGDTSLCQGDTLVLNPGKVGGRFNWSGGSGLSTLQVTTSGSYWLNYQNQCGEYSDTIDINFKEVPVVQLGDDTVLCPNDTVLLEAYQPGAQYLWSNGSTNSFIRVDSSGIYWVRLDVNGCHMVDSIQIGYQEKLNLNLGNDTLICQDSSFKLSLNLVGVDYLWNDGSKEQTLVINASGEYSVLVEKDGCYVTDTLVVYTEDCSVRLILPNIISPNNDGYNDLFRPIESLGIVSMNTVIYNRWGNEVFNTGDLSIDWNGSSQGRDVAPGVYYWFIQYDDRWDGQHQVYGTITVIR